MTVDDDPEVISETCTVRRAVHQREIVDDGVGPRRIQSSAFMPSSDGSGTSVVIAGLMGQDENENDRQPADMLATFTEHEIWTLSAEETRSASSSDGERLGLKHEPTVDEPGHANIKWLPT